ncbi:xanthine dehydrogenase/oxidase [Aplysia californica]|uniref:xanthine dehydrogenase n=1 Tax=Aplysia californica TaxID=6500 RepID=A0ABM0ZZ79_APLCA|nr:xanthine dehydrogenase/oxidase [Aplysia californica]
MEESEANNVVVFFVNGSKITEPNPDPEMTLLTYIRTRLRLTGSKLGCGEGGCGACTVMVSKYLPEQDTVAHFSVNACLAPVCSMHGLAVTTVEGIGSLNNLHPVQERIAKFHGSQCGFCTPGIVMSMYTLLRNNPRPTVREMEKYFDGNLCRCTGYRPILDGFRTFTKEYQCPMGESCCRNGADTVLDDGQGLAPRIADLKPFSPDQEPIFPPDLKVNHNTYKGKTLVFKGAGATWIQPRTLQELVELKALHPDAKIVVGNTEIGIETKFKNMRYRTLLCPTHIPELSCVVVSDLGVTVGGAVTLTQLNDQLQRLVDTLPEYKTRTFAAVIEMLRWFASHQIRNVASVCGNVLTASPISDLNPLLLAAGATLSLLSKERGPRTVPMDNTFFQGYRKTAVAIDEVLVSITIPFTDEREYLAGYKQATRKEDDISLVNAGLRVVLSADNKVTSATLAFGGMGETTLLAETTMAGLLGKEWNEGLIAETNELLASDLPLVPGSPGGVVEYRRALALSFFFKFFIKVRQQIDGSVLASELSAIEDLEQPTSQSMQVYGGTDSRESGLECVGQPLHHRSALQQSTGQALFLDDLPPAADELHMYLVSSTRPHARIVSVDPSSALLCPGVVDYVSDRDVPGDNTLHSVMDTVFARDEVTSHGQIIGAVVADSQERAREAARLVKVQYEDLETIVTIQEAIQHNSYLTKPILVSTGDVEEGFRQCEHILHGETHVNGQYHFYMETNVCRAVPGENGEIELTSASQNLAEVQSLVAGALGVPNNKVTVRTKRLGGGFGGKESQSGLLAAPVAVAAVKLGRTVRCVLDRDDDMIVTGNRHPYLGQYTVGFSAEGEITALKLDIYSNGGNSLDSSRGVMEKTLLEITSKYRMPNKRVVGRCCKTHLTSNTAFRGYGAPQGTFIVESILDDIAAHLHMEPKKVQERNLYLAGELTHYGTDAGGESLRRCWDMCVDRSQYVIRRSHVDKYNSENRWKKKGIALFPLAFGISFLHKFRNQSGALVHIYRDGSVLVSHGGVEMGQGLHTKLIQVASEVLQVPHSRVHISETSTSYVPNTSPTGASVSTDLNGMAVQDACQKLKARLAPIVKKRPNGSWDQWVTDAYMDCTSLSATGFYTTPGIGYDIDTNKGKPFHYKTFGAACTEVQIDCLTGDHKVLRTDIVMDIGRSINPAIDVGQIEGAFVQGYGMYMLEEIKVTPDGVHLTKGPGNYKIPAFGDIPGQFNVHIVPHSLNPNNVFASRGLNEPPLLLAMSVFLAVKDAIRAARRDNSADPKFQLFSPATPARIRMACKDVISSQFPEPEAESYKPWFVNL